MPHMKAWDVPFHLPYGSLICTSRLQSDRPKYRGLLVDPGAFQTHVKLGYLYLALFIPIYQKVSKFLYPKMLKISSFKWAMVALSPPKSDWVTDHIVEACFEAEGIDSTREIWKQGLPQPLWLSLGCFFELSLLLYLNWKRRNRAICWYQNQDHWPTDRYFMIIFWAFLGSGKHTQYFGLSLCNPLEQIKHHTSVERKHA